MLSVLLPLTCNSQGGLAAQIRFTSCLPLLLSQAGAAPLEEADYGGIAESWLVCSL